MIYLRKYGIIYLQAKGDVKKKEVIIMNVRIQQIKLVERQVTVSCTESAPIGFDTKLSVYECELHSLLIKEESHTEEITDELFELFTDEKGGNYYV